MARQPRGKRSYDRDGKLIVAAKNPNGDGSVYFVPSKDRWIAAYKLPGDPRRRTLTARTRTDAEARLAAILTNPTARTGQTVSELGEWWYKHLDADEIRPSTMVEYRKCLNRIHRTIGPTPVGAVTYQQCVEWQAAQAAKYAPQTVGNTRNILSRILTEAVAGRTLPVNPLDNFKAPRNPHRKRRTLTITETRDLITHARDCRYAAALPLMFVSGMRVSEVLGLAWDDVDLTAGRATVRRGSIYLNHSGQELGPTKNRGALGTHHLSPTAITYLTARRTAYDRERAAAGRDWQTITHDGQPVHLVFCTLTGGLVTRQHINRTIHRAATLAHIHCHDLATHTGRRTYVTRLKESGIPVADLSIDIGHADEQTTNAYDHAPEQNWSARVRSEEIARHAANLLDPNASPGKDS